MTDDSVTRDPVEGAAIERAAEAWFDRIQAARRDDGRKSPDGGPWRWEHLTEDTKRSYRAAVEPIVSAALDGRRA